MAVLGLHENRHEAGHTTYVRRARPTWEVVLDPAQGVGTEIVGASVATGVIGRPYEKDADVHDAYLYGDPEAAGRARAQRCIAEHGRNPLIKTWVVLNEPPCDAVWKVERLARFDKAFMSTLYAAGLRAVIGTFSGGNLQIPGIDGGAAIRAYEPAFRQAAAEGHYLGLHLYAAARPVMGGVTPSGWNHDPRYYAFRWRQEIFPWMRQKGIPIPKTIATEFGLDLGFARTDGGYQGEEVGWKADAPWGYGDSNAGADLYAEDLLAMAIEICKDAEVVGLCIYCAGDNGTHKWRSFMVDGYLLERLATMNFPVPPHPTQPSVNVTMPVAYVSQRGEGANESANDCGAAAVKSLVLINRAVVPSVNLLAREAAGIEGEAYPNYDGLTMTTLIELGRRYGATLKRERPAKWSDASWLVIDHIGSKRPIIALVHYDSLPVANRLIKQNGIVRGHYIVLVGLENGKVVYHDPYHDGTGGKGLKMDLTQLKAAWEANPQDNNPKHDMLIMLNPNWEQPAPPPSSPWTKQDAAAGTWLLEQLARAMRGDEGAKAVLIGAIQAEPKRDGLHNVIVAKALPPLQAERDRVK